MGPRAGLAGPGRGLRFKVTDDNARARCLANTPRWRPTVCSRNEAPICPYMDESGLTLGPTNFLFSGSPPAPAGRCAPPPAGNAAVSARRGSAPDQIDSPDCRLCQIRLAEKSTLIVFMSGIRGGAWPGGDVRDKKPLADIFMACRAQLARVVSRIVPPQDIEDIVQETYVRVCQYSGRTTVEHPHALMLSVARNLALDHVKCAANRLTTGFNSDLELESVMAGQATDESFNTVASNEEFARFCDALRQLPVQCRRVFILKKVYGYSQREIAAELGISENTVESHIATGLQQCIRYLGEQARKPASSLKAPGRLPSTSSIRS